MTGHVYRRYRFRKRTYRNQYLGPVRQPRDEPLHPVLPLRALLPRLRRRARLRRLRRPQPRLLRPHRGRRARERVHRQPGRGLPDRRLHRQDPEAPLHAQVGPADGAVGLRRTAALGCNTHPRRALRRRCAASATAINGEVNGYFLCDRGRYGYEFVNEPARIRGRWSTRRRRVPTDAMARGQRGRPTREALAAVARSASARRARRSRRTSRCARWSARSASSRARRTRERELAELALEHPARRARRRAPSLARGRATPTRCWCWARTRRTRRRCSTSRCARRVCGQPMRASSRELEIPRLERRRGARRAVQDAQGPLYLSRPAPRPSSTAVATRDLHAAPDDDRPAGGSPWRTASTRRRRTRSSPPTSRARIAEIAARMAAPRPLVVAGHGGWAARRCCGPPRNVAGALLAAAASRPRLLFIVARVQHARAWRCWAAAGLGGGASAVREAGEADTLIVLENDLYRRAAGGAVDALLCAAAHVVVARLTSTNPTTERAEVVLPAATFAESTARSSTTRAAPSASSRCSSADGEPSGAAGAGCATSRRPGPRAAPWRDARRRARARWPPSCPALAPRAEAAPPADFRRRPAQKIAAPAAPLQRPHGDARAP